MIIINNFKFDCLVFTYSSFFNFSGETDQFAVVETLVKGPAQKDGTQRIPFTS